MNETIPACIGIIMDGNRRYAKALGKDSDFGHFAGYEKLKELIEWAKEKGIKAIIAYALSTENWKRSKTEIDGLLQIFRFVLSHEVARLKKEKVAVKFIGDLDRFPKDLADGMRQAMEDTASDAILTLVLAVSYGGRAEIVAAAKKIVAAEKTEEITEENFGKLLWTAGIPDPDMIIRPGGEVRLSNFLPWQSIYSELFFTKTLWPDFTKTEFEKILAEYAGRKRNLGK